MVKNTLALVLELVNTRDLNAGPDRVAVEALSSPAALAEWLAVRGLVPGGTRVSGADLRDALAVREALRTLLLANNEVEIDQEPARETLRAAARRARLEPSFGGPDPLVVRAGGVAGALGAVLAEVHAAMADGSWARLKACRARDCEWAFVDQAKNRSRAWCSMRECGNRAKVRSFRERQRATQS